MLFFKFFFPYNYKVCLDYCTATAGYQWILMQEQEIDREEWALNSSMDSSFDREVRPTPSKRFRHSFFRGHCDRYLSNSSYCRHKDIYYNHMLEKWQRHDEYSSKRTSLVGFSQSLVDSPASTNSESVSEDEEYYKGTCGTWSIAFSDELNVDE